MNREVGIVVYQIPLSVAGADLEELLSAKDRAQLEQFVQPADRARRLLGHALLPLLDIYLEEQVCPECGGEGHGPVQTNTGFVSIAHSGQWVFVAVGDAPVGVDVQRLPCPDGWARHEAQVKCPAARWVCDIAAPVGYVAALAGQQECKKHALEDGGVLFEQWRYSRSASSRATS
ncbi:hypothetical protein [Corynebacterium pseudopelargi]|uniref:4'-phosphopantetheinyl transferase psf-1 n=1 Tax=Corynebacterium pseudopelargi TaxID=2080757 RepID=A0A3G6IZT4_9CORY|nr:hypothetical protein [Corynebacterium pseudopelargi]AZA10198.1 4'-phosphopantetheinyl transferase psf-1 [Corynebacterium pseudopelargi]